MVYVVGGLVYLLGSGACFGEVWITSFRVELALAGVLPAFGEVCFTVLLVWLIVGLGAVYLFLFVSFALARVWCRIRTCICSGPRIQSHAQQHPQSLCSSNQQQPRVSLQSAHAQ